MHVIIVGGGIVGLATAHTLLSSGSSSPGNNIRVTLVEKEDRVALHQSSHNSGVIHAGIYYRPNSERARMCVEGNTLMYAYLRQHRIPHKRVGKLIVATNTQHLDQLRQLYANATQNGVGGMTLLENQRDVHELEPHVRACAAILSENTGIVDYGVVAAHMATMLSDQCSIRTGFAVDSITTTSEQEVMVSSTSTGECVSGTHVIVCAGLESDRVCAQYPPSDGLTVVPFRGRYLRLQPEVADRVTRNIYPLPDPAFPFLGVHLTPTMDDDVKLLGPNAILALDRVGYDSVCAMNPRDCRAMLKHAGFRRFCMKHWRYGVREYANDMFISRMIRNHLRPMFPWLRPHMVVRSPEHTGIRAAAMSAHGELIDDFVFEHATDRILFVRNAPSPAATSCFAIAKRIVATMRRV